MYLIKTLRKATVIGEELGANHFCTANQKKYMLSHSGISFSVARNTFIAAAKDPQGSQGILPDHFVTQSITDHLNNIDTVLRICVGTDSKEVVQSFSGILSQSHSLQTHGQAWWMLSNVSSYIPPFPLNEAICTKNKVLQVSEGLYSILKLKKQGGCDYSQHPV